LKGLGVNTYKPNTQILGVRGFDSLQFGNPTLGEPCAISSDIEEMFSAWGISLDDPAEQSKESPQNALALDKAATEEGVLGIENPLSAEQDSAKKTICAESDCEKWLVALMAKTIKPTQAKSKYRVEAQKKLKGLSVRGFDRAWANAIKTTGHKAWLKPGRRPKS